MFARNQVFSDRVHSLSLCAYLALTQCPLLMPVKEVIETYIMMQSEMKCRKKIYVLYNIIIVPAFQTLHQLTTRAW